ncbi:MAG: hypothetical protein HYY24_29355 [Verrucomicrobia bacterium]|nr:hypothetical protein [Verrucomicrobiota bacterium]
MVEENQQQPPPPSPERKSLDEHAKLTALECLRYPRAHVVATFILRLWPAVQFADGPLVENGSYCGVGCAHHSSLRWN